MADRNGDRDGASRAGLPTGVVAAAVFVGAVAVLLVLLRGVGDVVGVRPVVPPDGIGALEERVSDRLGPVTLRPVEAVRVRVSDLRWRDRTGQPFVAAPRLTVTVRVGPAAGGDVVIEGGVIDGLEVRLVQAPGGAWNYEPLLRPLLDRRSAGEAGVRRSPPRIALRDVTLRDGDIRVRLPDALYRATNLDARLVDAALSGPGVADPTFRIARASTLLHLPDTTGAAVERPIAVEDATLRLRDGAVAFQVGSGTFGASTFADARGVWSPGSGGLGIDASLTVTDGRLADLPWLPGEVPEGTRGRMRLRVESLAPGRTTLTLTDASINAPGSAVTGSLTVLLTADGIRIRQVDARVDPLSLDLVEAFTGPLPYSGDLRGTIQGTGGDIRFRLAASLATSPVAEPFHTDLDGRVAFTDAGLEVRTVTAELDRVPLEALAAIAPGLPLAGPVTGTVTLEGPPGEAPIRLDTRLEAGGGIVTVAGTVALQATPPRYDLHGRLVGVELRRILRPAAPPAQIHASFTLRGAGLDPATADADLTANGSFTGWESRPGDTLAVTASVRNGLLRTQGARVQLGPVALSAAGEWRFAGGGGPGGAIRYDVEIASLQPLTPYLPAPDGVERPLARGRLSAEGRVSGTLDDPDVTGTVQARGFRYGTWAAGSLDGEYDLRVGTGLPRVEARFSGTDLRSPGGDFQSATVTVDFTRPTFQLAVQADQLQGGIVEVRAGGRIEDDGRRQIDLQRAEVDLQDRRWRLPAPAEIAWVRGGAIRVDDLRLEEVSGEGLLQVDGTVAPLDDADFRLEVRRLPVGDVLALVGSDIDVAGRLSLTGSVRGPAGSPTLELETTFEDGDVRGVAVRRFTGHVGYEGTRLTVDATGLLGDSARVQLTGTAPARLALGLPPSFTLVDGEPVALDLGTVDFPLVTLDPGIRSVTDVTGRLSADVHIAGTPDQPSLSGRLALEDGALTIPLLDRRYDRIGGTAVLEERIIRVDSLVAHSGGTALVTGRVVFDQLANPLLDLEARLDAFRPQGVPNDDGAAAWGSLRIGGTVRAPHITGDVRLDDGTVSIAPFQTAPHFSDAFVNVTDPLSSMEERSFDLDGEQAGGLTVAGLAVTAGEDVWFATDEARARLSGDLVVNRSGQDLAVQGTLEGNQGTFTLRVGPNLTRRFEIVDAHIRFFGSPTPNPALDITASRLVRTADGRDVDVRIRVGGTLDDPTLALASAGGGSLPESELFCFVALGRPCTELASLGGNPLMEAAALSGASELLADQLGGLDVDYFQLQARPTADWNDAFYLAVGEEFDQPVENLFLLLQLPVGGDVGTRWEASLEWRVTEQWTLELGSEPPSIIRNATTGRPLPDEFLLDPKRQWLWAVSRRWTY